ncbi:recombinase family protein [Streptomyces sp. NBC_01294]|uniref:recombinase family protein n=1 Tax=Streptomyces sp. NBC_01294 TaxID=2903815 RepID=UPI003FA35D72
MPAPRTERPLRIGYARTSTARQEPASQLEAFHRAECHKVFKEQISTRIKLRPELEKALSPAHQFKEAAPETPVILTVQELKRLARNAAELMTLSVDLQAGGIQAGGIQWLQDHGTLPSHRQARRRPPLLLRGEITCAPARTTSSNSSGAAASKWTGSRATNLDPRSKRPGVPWRDSAWSPVPPSP